MNEDDKLPFPGQTSADNTFRPPGGVRIRPAGAKDAVLLLDLIGELAAYEKLADAVRADVEGLAEMLFERRAADALIAEVDGEAAGYTVFFGTFSTFEARPGIWVEDIFVRPSQRRKGVGRALLTAVAQTALRRGCARVEWSALEWNEPALRFFAELGASRLDVWRMLRLEGTALQGLGRGQGE